MSQIAARLVLASLIACVGGCASAPHGTPPDIRALLESGQLEQGAARLEQLLAAAPDNIEARMLLANTRRQLASQWLARAGQAVRNEAWEEAQDGYRRAAALGEVDQAMVGMRMLGSAQRQGELLGAASALLAAGKREEARSALQALLAQFPNNQKAAAMLQSLGEREALAQGALAKGLGKRMDLQFRDAPLRAVFAALSQASSISFTFDKDVPSETRVTVNLVDMTVEQALRQVLASAQLDHSVTDERTILVYPRDPAKQREHQRRSIRSFRIVNAEAKAVAASLKTLLKTRDVVVDEKLNMLVVRDTPETLQMAARLVALHDVAEPEVMLEVEILEVQRSDLEALGVKWPGSASLTPLAATRTGPDGGVLTSAVTLYDLMRLNSRGVQVALDPMKLSAQTGRDSASVLANPRIRIKSREKALIRVGERVPSISSNVTSTGVTSQSVNYLDVGIKLEAEPVVYLDDEISIKLGLEVSSILGTMVDGNGQPYGYRIGARNANTVLRLRDGENQVLAGLISDNDKRSATAVPGLGELPLLDRLFGVKSSERTKTEIVLSITPRVVRNQPRTAWTEVEFDAGTDASLRGNDGTPVAPLVAPAPPPAPALPAPERSGG
ncbi:secretin N-terminal domain-containing protein [Massilia horti]|uniref:General secretion pathway protein GspD n=1 Tax=Massilia horti TaxID=2562153 RepID=A0A4Y9T9J5_9BURK|nr:secretin N-terminal domain-containing protein [Massilia horti]TFW36185.1 general secretion pathway protein GspD [Massilia horti]